MRKNIQMDEVGAYSVTEMKSAQEITNLIIEYLCVSPLTVKRKLKIIDGCAGIGGNTLSFAKYFSKVTAVELSTSRCEMLKNNLQLLGFGDKVEVVNADFCKMIKALPWYDVVFLDPPWGGKDYKKECLLDIFMGDMSIQDVCVKLEGKTGLVVLKLPKNFNIVPFRKAVESVCKIELESVSRIPKILLIILRYPTKKEETEVTNKLEQIRIHE